MGKSFFGRLNLATSVEIFLQIHVPLEPQNPSFADQHLPSSNEDSLLPMSHLSPKTLLGASNSERETTGQLYAVQIASAILTRNPDERRQVLVGLGLRDVQGGRHAFYDIIDLALRCI